MAVAVATETQTLLEVKDLHVNLGQSHVLQGVSFDVPEGGVTALLGRNGVGKTTTLRAIMGLAPEHHRVERRIGEQPSFAVALARSTRPKGRAGATSPPEAR